MKYSVLNAIIYDVLWRLCESLPSLRGKGWVRMAMDHCFPDWVEWKTEVTMADVDRQVEQIKEEWAKDDPKPEFIEHPPDGSKAQELLGGAMEIRSPWSKQKEM